MLRGLIDSIVLMPEKGQLRNELRGNLAAMLTAAQKAKRSPEIGDLLMPYNWLRGRATAGTCSSGVALRSCRWAGRVIGCEGDEF
jgi:hypothetical protein